MSRTPDPQTPRDDARTDTRTPGDTHLETTLAEERLSAGTETYEAGRVRAVKHVDTERVEQRVPKGVEHAELDRQGVAAGDSGQVETLPDGSLSIPVFEEQIVVEKRLVVRERVIVRKTTVYEEEVVSADVRRERLEIETDGDVRVTETGPGGTAPR